MPANPIVVLWLFQKSTDFGKAIIVVLVDILILAQAPAHFLVSGMGDALAIA